MPIIGTRYSTFGIYGAPILDIRNRKLHYQRSLDKEERKMSRGFCYETCKLMKTHH